MKHPNAASFYKNNLVTIIIYIFNFSAFFSLKVQIYLPPMFSFGQGLYTLDM